MCSATLLLSTTRAAVSPPPWLTFLPFPQWAPCALFIDPTVQLQSSPVLLSLLLFLHLLDLMLQSQNFRLHSLFCLLQSLNFLLQLLVPSRLVVQVNSVLLWCLFRLLLCHLERIFVIRRQCSSRMKEQ